MQGISSHLDAARYLYNEFYLGQVRLAVLRNVNTLRIADFLKDGPKDIKELAKLTNSHEQSLHRVMITAFQMGLFNMDGNVFSLNLISDLLVTDTPASMSGLMAFTCEDFMVQSCVRLGETIQTGIPSFINVTGQTFYEHLREHEEQRNNFNAAMVAIDKTVSPLLATKYDWSGVNTFVDLGGGVGSSALHVLKENSKIKNAIVLEVQDVVDKAKKQIPNHIINFGAENVQRLTFAPGSMFEPHTIPQAQVYMLKNIVHDWNDTECDILLNNVKLMLNGDASKRLLVVEKIVQPDKIQPRTAGHDIIKMCFFHEHAKHRDISNFENMFSRNGFTLTKVVPLEDTDYYVMEGRVNTQVA
jgi:hypothetical protein